MKISYRWLKDYVDIQLPPEKLAQKLTMAGLEVTSLEEKAGDWIFEIEITSNRPDWLSFIGIAREVAVITGKKLKLPKTTGHRLKTRDQNFKIELQDKTGCPQYTGILIKGVSVKESPLWLQQKIASVGLRPINNVADITNFCLMETGQPMHAFDFDKLSAAKIIVRRAKLGETIQTIDAAERKLTPEILVIADAVKPVAVAGVMGALDIEVTVKTKNLLLESAYFNPAVVRQGARILGLSTDASYRFERSVDRENILPAALRAVDLIRQLAGASVIACTNQLGQRAKKASSKIRLSQKSVEDLLGIKITAPKIKQILTSLQFKVSAKKNLLQVSVPSFRQDVKEPVDLIEEVARISGFDNVPDTLPQIRFSAITLEAETRLKDLCRNFFSASGFSEIISYSLISRDLLRETCLDFPGAIAIKNPLSLEQEILATSIIPGLLTAIKNNLNHNTKDLKLFEIGKRYLSNRESSCLGIAICGEKSADWSRIAQDKVDFFDLKGALEAFLKTLGISNFQIVAGSCPAFGNCAALKIGQEEIGILGEVADAVLDNWDIKLKGIFLAEINLEKLQAFMKLDKRFSPMIDFPAIARDISLVIPEGVAASQVFSICQEIAAGLLANLRLVELYCGGQIPKGFKGLTISLEYQAKGRTLTDNEVNPIHEKLCQAFIDQLKAKIR